MKQIIKMMLVLMLLWLSIYSSSLAQKFHVIDVDKGTDASPMNNYWFFYDGGSRPFEDAVLNGIAYFGADDGIHGREFWRSNGTEAGTKMIKDINPGLASSDIHDITVSGGKLFFAADDGQHGREIWVSDGTTQGTKMLKDIYPGSTWSDPSYLIDVNGTLYFFANVASVADQLWKTDGTKQGTTRVANFYTAKFGFSGYAWQLANVNNRMFFVLNGQLYTTDGTSDGTVLVKDGFTDVPLTLTAFKGMLYFSADDGNGRQLWVSDGTNAGTHRVNNNNNIYLNNDPFNNELNKYTTKGNKLFFPGYSSDNDGSKLCSYDVSDPSNNVEIIKDFVPGKPSHNLYNLININGAIFFTVYAGTNSDQSLWKSDGTTNGTVLVKDINPGGLNVYFYKEFKNANGTLLFAFEDNVHGAELWKSDGTEAGTTIVKELVPGVYNSTIYAGAALPEITYVGNNISLFSATDGTSGLELWRTDCTKGGTKLVKDINESTTYSSSPGWLTTTGDNGNLIFTAGTFKYGDELWKSNGTEASLVKDILPGSAPDLASYPFDLLNVNNTTYLFASIRDTTAQNTSDLITAVRLFKTDGTTSGTKIIEAPALQNTISYNGYVAATFATCKLYYALVYNFNTSQYELWRTDGTKAGTFAVKTDIDGNYWPQPTAVDNMLFFTNNDTTYGDELWRTDGTIAGTKIVKNINKGSNSSNPFNLFAFNNKLYFDATDVNSKTYIWSSDGTTGGTNPVKKTVIADWWLGEANNKLLFAATDPYHGEELWGTDGTGAVTKLIKDIFAGPNSSTPGTGVSTGSLVYFTAATASYGSELWKSDGTPEGTKMVKDIVPGTESSFLGWLVAANSKLYFVNNDALWSSDGTADGTEEINDGGLSGVSGLANLTPAGDKLYFTGFANATGNELYVGDISCHSATSSNTDMITKQNFDKVYPNPAKDVLHVYTNGTADFVIIDQSGKQLLTETIVNNGIINTADLAAGVYYLKNNATGTTQKIIIVK
jgi:ELWxxDGT repeat protein